MLGRCTVVCHSYKSPQYDDWIILLDSRYCNWRWLELCSLNFHRKRYQHALWPRTLIRQKPQEVRPALKHPSWRKKKGRQWLFFFHEVKVVLISYLYPGTFVKQIKCAHRYKINDKLCNFSLNHDLPMPEIWFRNVNIVALQEVTTLLIRMIIC